MILQEIKNSINSENYDGTETTDCWEELVIMYYVDTNHCVHITIERETVDEYFAVSFDPSVEDEKFGVDHATQVLNMILWDEHGNESEIELNEKDKKEFLEIINNTESWRMN